MKITAKVEQVFPVENIPTKSGGTFSKRVVWAIDESNPQFPNPLEFEFSGQGISTPDRLMPGMIVEFECAIQGNKWTSQAGKTGVSMRLRTWGANVIGQAPQQYNPQQPQPIQYPQQATAYGQQQQPQTYPQQPQQYPQQQPGGYQNVPANPYGGQPVAQPQGQPQQTAPTGYGPQQQQQAPPQFVPPLPPSAPANPYYQQPTVDQRVANGDLPF